LKPFEIPGFGTRRGPQVFQHERYDAERKAPVYQEFLCPLRGGKTSIVTVQEGLSAQALRYLDLLAFEPIVVTVESSSEIVLTDESQIHLVMTRFIEAVF
jgi:hypothetical protein